MDICHIYFTSLPNSLDVVDHICFDMDFMRHLLFLKQILLPNNTAADKMIANIVNETNKGGSFRFELSPDNDS